MEGFRERKQDLERGNIIILYLKNTWSKNNYVKERKKSTDW